MSNNKVLVIIGLAASVGFVSALQANPIVGSIGFIGSYVQNGGVSGDLTTATSITMNNPVSVANAYGDFGPAGTVILNAFITSIGVNGNLGANVPGNQLWSITQGGTTYTFTLTTEAQVFALPNLLNMQGGALVSDGIAADNTPGVWTLSFGASGDSFTWNNTSATAPDGGVTAILLGGGMWMLGFLRRKLSD